MELFDINVYAFSNCETYLIYCLQTPLILLSREPPQKRVALDIQYQAQICILKKYPTVVHFFLVGASIFSVFYVDLNSMLHIIFQLYSQGEFIL